MPSEIAPFDDYYDSEPSSAEAESARFFDPAPLRLVLEHARLEQAEPAILDLGCGSGRALHWFKVRGWQVHGIDHSAGQIALARNRVPDAKLDHKDLRFFSPSGPEVERYTAVIATRTLMHLSIEECQRTFASVFRTLQPRAGVFLLSYLASAEPKGSRARLEASRREVTLFHPMQIGSLLRQSGFTLLAEGSRNESYGERTFESHYQLLRRV